LGPNANNPEKKREWKEKDGGETETHKTLFDGKFPDAVLCGEFVRQG